MSLTTGAAMMTSSKSGYHGMTGGTYDNPQQVPTETSSAPHRSRALIAMFVLLIIVDIAILVFAVHYILECSKAHKWSPMVTLLLIAMLFAPGIGGLLSIAIIIYGLTGGCKAPGAVGGSPASYGGGSQMQFAFY